MKGALLDVVAITGPYAAAILHKGSTVSHRSLTFASGRWYDGNHGQAACAPEIYEMPGAYPPASTWGVGGFAAYFDAGSSRQGSSQDGTVGRDPVTLIVAMSGTHATKGSIGARYWSVLTIDLPAPGVYCAYGADGRLTHEMPHAALQLPSQLPGPGRATTGSGALPGHGAAGDLVAFEVVEVDADGEELAAHDAYDCGVEGPQRMPATQFTLPGVGSSSSSTWAVPRRQT